MTRKDYILIAAALNEAREFSTIEERRYGVERAALRLADAIGQDNPRFDRGRFLAACGLTEFQPKEQAA